MWREQNKPSKQATNEKQAIDEEASLRMRQMSACEGIEMDVTGADIWVSHANTPEGDLNLRQFIAELERGGIATEAKSFYCG